jgi:ribosomal protein L20
MQIRRYGAAALLFMVVIGWFIFAFVTQDYTGNISIGDKYFVPDMPIAVAVLIPAIILFILTLAHMVFFFLLDYFKNTTKKADFQRLEQAIMMSLKNKVDEKPHYTSKKYRDIGELLNSVKITPNDIDAIDLSDKNKYKEVVDTLIDLKDGKVVELPSNAGYHLKELNLWNELKESENIAESILMERGFYSDELYAEAFNALCKSNTYQTIQRYERWFNIDGLWNIIHRVNAEENPLHLEKDELLRLISQINFFRTDYTKLAQVMRHSSIEPDVRISIFKTLLEKSDDATEGYIYTLLDLEMVSDAQSALNELQPDELENLKAYIAVKDHNLSSIDIDYFIRG